MDKFCEIFYFIMMILSAVFVWACIFGLGCVLFGFIPIVGHTVALLIFYLICDIFICYDCWRKWRLYRTINKLWR